MAPAARADAISQAKACQPAEHLQLQAPPGSSCSICKYCCKFDSRRGTWSVREAEHKGNGVVFTTYVFHRTCLIRAQRRWHAKVNELTRGPSGTYDWPFAECSFVKVRFPLLRLVQLISFANTQTLRKPDCRPAPHHHRNNRWWSVNNKHRAMVLLNFTVDQLH